MLKKIFIFLFIFINFLSFSEKISILEKYNKLQGLVKPSYELFEKGYIGYLQIPNKTSELLVLIDYTKPSSEERFYILDLGNNKILHTSRIAHSKNSGLEIPIKFSNDPNSFENSLGFYLTLGEYNGSFGHSLKLKGLEENINSNAEERAIVIHGGEIANDDYLKKYGFLGRSLGCPVLPTELISDVIGLIKNGTVVFIFGNDENYMNDSIYMRPVLNSQKIEIIKKFN